MREAVVPFALLACACGAAALRQEPPPSPRPSASSSPAASSAAATDAQGAAAFAALATSAATVAPGMREVARAQSAGSPAELLHAVPSDACLRVAYEADAPTRAKLVDEAGHVLAESPSSAASGGVLGTEGPVCVRKGDSVVAITDTPGVHVRWIAWQAP